MTVDSWDPNKPTPDTRTSSIDPNFISRCLELVTSNKLNTLEESMTAQDKQQSSVMKANQTQWEHALVDYSNDQLIDLIKFFTLVEVQIAHWVGAHHSPAIAINNILKSRGQKLDKSVLTWIRKNTNNRFIPNGAVL